MTPSSADARETTLIVRRAMTSFIVGSLAAFLLVAAGVIGMSALLSRQEAVRHAERVARGISAAVVAPLAGPALHQGDGEALARLDEAIRARMHDGTLYRVKVWEDRGDGVATILYSDDKRLTGRTFELDPEEQALFGTASTHAEISDLEKSENVFERDEAPLVEVYAGFTDASGSPLVFEAYFPAGYLTQDGWAIARQLLPLTLSALLLLELATLPLAFMLARRIAVLNAERRRALHLAEDATDGERRRIAQDLHDGVVQDLAGVGIALETAHRQLALRDPEADVTATVLRAGDIVRDDVAQLRSLLTDIYPVDVDDLHLVPAVRELTGSVAPGLSVTVDAPADLIVPQTTAVAAFRVIRESLRNVVRHAHARHVTVVLAQQGARLLVDVTDDGRGFDDTDERPLGHFGLRVLEDAVRAAGGELTVRSSPGSGATVSADLPL